MNETKQKGLITELHCQLDFSNLGILLLAPITEDSRYDFVADVNGSFIRIQCKTCSISERKDYIKFATRSTRSNAQESLSRYYTKDEIDYFYTYYNNQGYLVKVEETSAHKILRFFSDTPNNPTINWAKDFEIEKVLKQDLHFNPQYNMINVIKDSTKVCIDCGKSINRKSISRCPECAAKAARTVERPTREELKELIRKLPFTKIGEQFKVTDNTIRKWCIAENLPSKKKEILKYSEEEWENI